MRTSYFAKHKADDGVSIAIKAPPGFTGSSYPPLYPKWSFLKKYREDGDEDSYTKAYYDQVLNKLDPKEVYLYLEDSTLLCWEKSGSFCHRRIVAAWLKKTIGVDVEEIG
jgi:uncharacterized protein (DUF488 family)